MIVRAGFAGLTFFAALSFSGALAADTSAGAPDPNDPKYMWDLGDLYPTPEAWTAEHDKIKAAADKLDSYKGTLGKSSAAMLKALDAISQANKETLRLNTYASLAGDADLSNSAAQERRQLGQELATEIGTNTAWIAPEILKVGAKKVAAFEKENKELAHRFDFFLADTLRAAPHTLGAEAEGVLAAAGDVVAQPQNVRNQLAHSDVPVPTVHIGGEDVKLDDAAYTKYRQLDDRADRKKVFDAFFGTYKNYEHSYGAMLTNQVMLEAFNAKVRHFPNSLAAATFADNMPDSVYRTLVAQANAGLPVLYRYLKLRKQLLGIAGDMEYYDVYPNMFKSTNPPKFSVEESERLTIAALAPYGDEYLDLLKHGFASRWMNAYPHPHKASGAYMNGSAYDVHPYLLLNHTGDYLGLSTLAHEWGHGVHTMLADKAQPFDKSNYPTFIAETASIGNEMMLNDYMVAHAKNNDEKLYYLGQGVESIRQTFFRQVQLAEFQLAIHDEFESGKPLSGERMTQIYCDLLKKYYGDAQGITKINPAYCVEWAYIPHFYFGYYVWQYATSMAGAAQLTDDIVSGGTPARDRFITMLKAGGSDYPYDLYKKAGIDMATPEPYQKLVARMSHLLDQIDEIEKQK